MTTIKLPRTLKTGSQIAIVSPAGYLSNPSLLDHVVTMIQARGHTAVFSEHHRARHDNYYAYAGTTEQRLADLQWAFDDPDIDAIWATRGGYGSVHLLENIDFEAFINKPKWLIGYSDITYLHAFLNKHGVASIHGHNVVPTLSNSIQPPVSAYNLVFDITEGKLPEYKIESHPLNKTGKASGRLVGGNQTIVGALSGTRYNFDYQDAILFLEEIGENAYYRIDRQMQTLESAGALGKIKGLVIGSMRDIGGAKSDFDQSAYKLINQLTQQYDIPKIFAFPAGHVHDNRPLVMGANVEIEVERNTSILRHKAPSNCN